MTSTAISENTNIRLKLVIALVVGFLGQAIWVISSLSDLQGKTEHNGLLIAGLKELVSIQVMSLQDETRDLRATMRVMDQRIGRLEAIEHGK